MTSKNRYSCAPRSPGSDSERTGIREEGGALSRGAVTRAHIVTSRREQPVTSLEDVGQRRCCADALRSSLELGVAGARSPAHPGRLKAPAAFFLLAQSWGPPGSRLQLSSRSSVVG